MLRPVIDSLVVDLPAEGVNKIKKKLIGHGINNLMTV